MYLNSQENTPYEPSVRTNTIWAITKNSHPHEALWKHGLSFIPDLVVQKTLKATTQFVPMVEAESREHMEAYHPNQNTCERCSGVLKVATSHLLLVTGAPLNFGVTLWSILRCFSRLLPIGI